MRKIVIVAMSVMFFFSSLHMTHEWNEKGILTVYISLIFILLSVAIFKRLKLKYNKMAFALMFTFLIFGFWSAVFNSEVGLIASSFLMFILYISGNIIIPAYFQENTEKIVVRLIVVSHIPLLLLPILLDRINSMPYQGIFYNPNSLGGVAVTVFVVFASMFFGEIEKVIFYENHGISRNMILNVLIMLGLLLLIASSASRTSFLAGLIAIVTGLLFLVVTAFRYKRVTNLFMKSAIITPFAILFYFVANLFLPLNDIINRNIIEKFQRKSGDILDRRGDVWVQTIQEAGLFGKGQGFFTEYIGISSHNTFISILGMYGWVPFVVYGVFFIMAFYYSVRYCLNSNSKYKYLPVLMLVTFLSLSMAENMLYKLSMLATFILVGVCMNQRKIIIT